MKNKLNVLLVLALILGVTLGCGITERVQKTITGDKTTSTPDNRSVGDKTIDDVTDTESTGVPECDEVVNIINRELAREAQKDDNWATRATRNFFFSQIKKSIKASIDDQRKNANSDADVKKIADTCRDYKEKIEIELKKDSDKANGQ